MKTTYVCEPNTMIITTSDSIYHRKLDIFLYVSNKEAFQGTYSLITFTTEEVNDNIKMFCNSILKFTEDEIQDHIDANKIMPALYAYRSLKKSVY